MTALLHFPYLLWGVLFAVLDVQEVQFHSLLAEHFISLLLLLDGNLVTLNYVLKNSGSIAEKTKEWLKRLNGQRC